MVVNSVLDTLDLVLAAFLTISLLHLAWHVEQELGSNWAWGFWSAYSI
jgi:hypothetical protein